MDTRDDSKEFDKFEELYRLTKEGLEAETARSNRLDEKAVRYLSFLTIVGGIGAFAGPGLVQALAPLEGFLDWMALGASGVLLLIVFVAAALRLNVLRIQAWVAIPMDEEIVKYFKANEYMTVLFSMAIENIRTIESNRRRITDRKARKLQWAYHMVMAALAVAAVAVLAYSVALAAGSSK